MKPLAIQAFEKQLGENAFLLYTSFGVPVDLYVEKTKEWIANMGVSEEWFAQWAGKNILRREGKCFLTQ